MFWFALKKLAKPPWQVSLCYNCQNLLNYQNLSSDETCSFKRTASFIFHFFIQRNVKMAKRKLYQGKICRVNKTCSCEWTARLYQKFCFYVCTVNEKIWRRLPWQVSLMENRSTSDGRRLVRGKSSQWKIARVQKAILQTPKREKIWTTSN